MHIHKWEYTEPEDIDKKYGYEPLVGKHAFKSTARFCKTCGESQRLMLLEKYGLLLYYYVDVTRIPPPEEEVLRKRNFYSKLSWCFCALFFSVAFVPAIIPIYLYAYIVLVVVVLFPFVHVCNQWWKYEFKEQVLFGLHGIHEKTNHQLNRNST